MTRVTDTTTVLEVAQIDEQEGCPSIFEWTSKGYGKLGFWEFT
jgi:hypothetical protein